MLQEKDILQDMLVLDKDIMKYYTNYIIESSCTKERNLLEKNFKDTSKEQYGIYSVMVEKGFYPVKNAEPADVKTAKQTMSKIQKQLQ